MISRNFLGWVMKLASFVVVALTGMVCSAQTIYKCPDANGRLSMQDTPCAGGSTINVKPASGGDGSAPASPTKAPVASVERKGLKSDVEQMARERRLRELDFEVSQRNSRIGGIQADSERRMALLRDEKLRAKNNLAGATWEQSLSAEMQAIATDTQTKLAALQGEIATLEKELTNLKAEDKAARPR